MYILSPDIKLISGFTRNCIYDLKRRTYYWLSAHTFNSIRNIETINNNISNINPDVLKFLIEKEIILEFPVNLDKHMQELVSDFDICFSITSAVILVDITKFEQLGNVINLLNNINCKHISFCFDEEPDFDELNQLFEETIKFGSFYIIDVLYNFIPTDEKAVENKFVTRYLIFHANQLASNSFRQANINNIVGNMNEILGGSNDRYFHVSFDHFFESRLYNTFFNKRIYIDKDLNVKEHFHSYKNYGHAINFLTEFNKYEIPLWLAKKDDTEICKDCEFRYMCLDDRVPVYYQKENIWKHLTKCKYDPYSVEPIFDEIILGELRSKESRSD